MPLTPSDKEYIKGYLRDDFPLDQWPNYIIRKLTEDYPGLFYALRERVIMEDIIKSIINGKDWK